MKVYSNWKHSKGKMVDETHYIVNITNNENVSWYNLMGEIDKRKEKWVVGIHSKEGWISWFTEGHVSGKYAPNEGSCVILVDEFIPKDADPRDYIFDGTKFVLKPPKEIKSRSKEDILADLEKLKAELLSS